MTPDAADLPDFDNGRTRQPRFGIMHRKHGLLLLAVFLQQLEHTGPASAVVFARDRLLAQTAVRDLHVCAGAGARELPAYETAALRLIVPVGDPGIRQNARRIEFNNLSMSFEFAHDVDLELAGGIGGLEAPLAADARVHFKNGNLADVVVPPLHLLDGVGQGAKHALRRRGDMNFTNNGVEIRSDDGSWHVCSSLFSASCCAEILSRIRSLQKFSSWPDWRAKRCGIAPARSQQLSAALDSACKSDGGLPFSPGPSVPAAAGADVWRLQDVKQEMRGRFGLLAGCLVEADRAPRGAWDRRGPERRVLPNM